MHSDGGNLNNEGVRIFVDDQAGKAVGLSENYAVALFAGEQFPPSPERASYPLRKKIPVYLLFVSR